MLPGASIYVIEEPFLPWLWPLATLCGTICQVLGLYLNSLWLPGTGLILVLAGSMAEKDPSFAVADIIATFLIYAYLLSARKSGP